jgi:RNase P subunit RPR2
VLGLDLDDVAHVQVSVDCLACGESFDHRIRGAELRMVNDWTVEAVTVLDCPHCGDRTRWTIEEELRRDARPDCGFDADGPRSTGTRRR